jgi:MFS transporter, DHA1 family, tetracycline resistance protein
VDGKRQHCACPGPGSVGSLMSGAPTSAELPPTMPDAGPNTGPNNDPKPKRGRAGKTGKSAREPMPPGFWVVWTTVVIDLIGFGIAIPVLNPFARELGSTPVMIGFIGAAFSLAQFVVAPMLGRLSDRIGRKPVLVLSLAGTAIGSLATGLATAPWMLMAARAFDGASGATLGVAQAAVADIAPPRRRAALLGMLGAAFGIGFTIGPAISGVAVLLGGRRAPFFVAAAMAAANAVATVMRFPNTKTLRNQADVGLTDADLARELVSADGASTVSASTVAASADGVSVDGVSVDGVSPGGAVSLARTWRENGLPLLIVIGGMTTLAFTMFEQMFALYGEDRIGFTKSSAPWAFVIIGIVVSVVQGGLIRPAIAAIGERTLLLGGTVAVGLGLALVSVTRSWPMLIPVLVLLSLGQGFASPTMQATMTNAISADVRGELLGVVARWGSLARVAGPIFGGFLFQKIGKESPFLLGASLYAVSFLLLFRSSRVHSAPPGVSSRQS